MEGQPNVGQVVHYRSHGTPVREDGAQEFRPTCRAAIVTQTLEGFMGTPLAGLAVLNPTGLLFEYGLPGPDPEGCASTKSGTWHWPKES